MYQIWQIVRALQRAHVFAARKVHWTLRLSGSALRITFSRYALSEKAGRSAYKNAAQDLFKRGITLIAV
ncbi:hypothetical protein CJ214_03040 [Peptoniphilus lacrimalis]|nr:hypothetical protein CJ214_03040 [Peptoniphilus lacrimalis]